MEDLVERYYKDFLFFCGTAEEMKTLLRKSFMTAGDIRERSTIKFFARRHHNKMLARKAEIDNGFKKFISQVDDLVAVNAKTWKALDAKYRYFYKDIERK